MRSSKFLFIGNNKCIDFINTMIIEKKEVRELLDDFEDLMQWFQDAGILDKQEKNLLITKWKSSLKGRSILEKSKVFREDLRLMIEKLIETHSVDEQSIEMINNILSQQSEHTYLKKANGKLELNTKLLIKELIHLLVPIAKSAAYLLSHADYSHIKKCENPGCILYHYDTSKNQKRRWCSMKVCGNRMKAAAFYNRKKRKVS